MGTFGNTFGRLYSYSVFTPEAPAPEVNTVYVDPTNSDGGRDGSIENPYNAFTEITLQNDYTYKLKAGTTLTTATHLYCNGLSNVTFTSYGTGDLPKFIFTGGGSTSYCIMFNSCSNITLDSWDVSGNNAVWSVIRNDNSSGTTITNCELHDALYAGDDGGFGIRSSGSINFRILNTHISYTGNDGFYCNGNSYNLEIGYCRVEYVNQSEPNTPGNNSGGGDGIQLNGRYDGYHIHHTIIDRNVDSIGNKYCLLVDQAATSPVLDGGIIEYCTFRHNANVLGGVILGHNLNTIVRYNTFEGPYGGEGAIKLSGGSCQGTLIYGNKFYNIAGKGITLGYSYSGSGNWGPSTGTKIYNNVFYNLSAYGTNWGCIWNDRTTAECKNNIFHMNGNTSAAFTNYSGAIWTLSNNCFDALSSVGNSGQGTNAVVANPLFVDAPNKDFHLTAVSPCINAGVYVNITKDFDGVNVPQGIAPDIGVYEYV